MAKPILLDLFCGAGGASVGYARAGFDVIGMDIEAHDDYPFFFIQGDAMAFLRSNWRRLADRVAVVAASPPCPRYSVATPDHRRDEHPDYVAEVRGLLRAAGVPYVIENVPGSPLENPIRLCGSMFGLGVRRHRLFESSEQLTQPSCDHRSQSRVWGVYGDHGDKSPVTRPDGTSRGNKARDAEHAGEVMGIDWMKKWKDLADAIPPAYTEHIGKQLLAAIH